MIEPMNRGNPVNRGCKVSIIHLFLVGITITPVCYGSNLKLSLLRLRPNY